MPTLISPHSYMDYTYIPVIVLAAVFLLIAVRQVGRFTLRIWQIMLGGALAVILSGQITPADAVRAINIDVMVFLFGMFVVGEALVRSGYLGFISYRLFRRALTVDRLVITLILFMGILSGFLMNDTLAIIGTPLVLTLAARSGISPKLLLLSLAVAITTGSVMSPIGNPQNLLVAVNTGMQAPFVTFAWHLALPSLINLIIAFAVLKIFYRKEFSSRQLRHQPPEPVDTRSMRICQCSLGIIITLVAVNVVLSLAGREFAIALPLIALCAAAPVLILSGDRIKVLSGIDWYTLVFFAAMFVLMASVWQTGFFQSFVGTGAVSSVPMILATGVVISQFISNVPFVALFQPMIMQAGGTTAQLLALAAGSTIAGNLTILGAASNVIIIQNAEKQGETLTFWEFARPGIPLTILQVAVYAMFLALM
ncbi:MAG: SLC13 family permease [Methanoregula sp.]|nr:MAG: SLC13 family permease [Methanoregula sp.]